MKKITPVFYVLLLIVQYINLNAQTNIDTKAKAILSKMTLEEKVNLVVGMGMKFPGMPNANGPTVGQTMDRVPGAAGTLFAMPKLGIPTTVVADGPAGLRIEPIRNNDSSKTFYCTAFPIATLLASSWDTALVKQVGMAMGNEVKEYGCDILLAPALNIHRNPLAGRNFEYYSEDPIIAGNIAAAMVNGIESNGVGTSIKHFAVNNQETNRNYVDAVVSERALREIYLRGFEITVKKSQPWTVMSSYNKLNGTYTSQTYDLLTTILRNEWGFNGYVMTDWFGGDNAVEQLKAGNDLLMPGTPKQKKEINDALQNKTFAEKQLDENVLRILKNILITPSYNQFKYSNKPNLKANSVIARNAAADGMILLKNENVLPLKTTNKIAVFGNTSYDFIAGGTGSGDVNEAYTISLVDGLKNTNLKIDANLKSLYESFLTTEKAKAPKKSFFFELPKPLPQMDVTTSLIEQKVKENDIAFITIGRNAGEFQDRKEANDYYLSSEEINLIKNVSSTFHANRKKVVVILNIGGVIDASAWKNDVDAILLSWQGGQEAGNAVADIITGKVNPSGKLATTFPASYNDDPSAKNFPGKNLSSEEHIGIGGMKMGYDSEVVYEEDIFVGYRYYNTYKVNTAFPFGYGLSYTQFEYSNVKMNTSVFTKNIKFSVEVKNTGKTAGKEVVQVYLSAPTSAIKKPTMELKAFAKTKLLQPNEKQIIQFELNEKDLASYNTSINSWVADAGKYTIKVGTSSENIVQQSTFNLPKEIIVEKCNKVLAPQKEISASVNEKAASSIYAQ